MSAVLQALRRHAAHQPGQCAIEGIEATLGYRALHDEAAETGRKLADAGVRRLGLALDNSPAWIVSDLAAMSAGIPMVPLPPFFTARQNAHALRDAGIGHALTDRPAAFTEELADRGIAFRDKGRVPVAGKLLRLFALDLPAVPLPPGTVKITYTSGTTGDSRGVCLDQSLLDRVAAALAAAAAFTAADRHFCVLPLATLLENVAGLYAPILAGACCLVPPPADAGMTGSSGFDALRLIHGVARRGATTAILLPQLLKELTAVADAERRRLRSLRYVAVGGSRVAPALLASARDVGLPVYEGYGLSECGSVVALNTPAADKPGSVGRPLPHVGVAIAPDGEIRVRGAAMLGYTGGAAAPAPEWVATGDLGMLDENSFLHVTGRKKNVLITSYGRNVAPEWVESELEAQPGIAGAAVYGDARPWCAAVIASPLTGSDEGRARIAALVAAANRALPDYAQVHAWVPADAPFSAVRGELTANGRLRRDVIRQRYGARIDQLYGEALHGVL
ncbi:MAG: AMP-binding protein [Pseudomonadota bacterium]